MAELLKNSEYTVVIDGYNSSGHGVARIGGQVVFIKGAIRDEECRISILKALKNVVYARLVEVLKPSPHRISPKCGNFRKCGGCDFLHMSYGEELYLKHLRVEDTLRRVGGFDISVPPVVGAAITEGYRNKAIYAVGYGNDAKPAAGFYRERSHDIVPSECCLIQTEFSRRAAQTVTRWMDTFSIPAYDEKTGSGAIRHIFCRNAFATGMTQIVIVTADETLRHIPALTDSLLRACPETASIVLNVNKTRGNTVIAGDFRTIYGDEYIIDELLSLKFRLSPRSFFQINSAQTEKLYKKAAALAALEKNDTALDLYCGIGTITLLLAGYAGRVIGSEIVPDAVRDARLNAELNGISNAEFICADTAQAIQNLRSSGITPAAVVVDPPRKGLAPGVINSVAGMSPKRIVYISCDPATLARDLKLFSGLGYSPASVTPFDMFPRCAHVETVVLLSKLKSTSSFEVKIDL